MTRSQQSNEVLRSDVCPPRPRTARTLTHLPPEGASPAGDLQRRVGEVALRSFYRPAEPVRWPGPVRWGAVAACGGLCWCAVLGIGGLLA